MTLEQAIRKLHPAMLSGSNGEHWDTDVLLSDTLEGLRATPGEYIVDGDEIVLMRADGYRDYTAYRLVEG